MPKPDVSSVESHGSSGMMGKVLFGLIGLVVGGAAIGAGMYFWFGQLQAEALDDQRAAFDQEKTVLSNQISTIQTTLNNQTEELTKLQNPPMAADVQIENKTNADPGKDTAYEVIIKNGLVPVQTLTYTEELVGRIVKATPFNTYIEIINPNSGGDVPYRLNTREFHVYNHKTNTLNKIEFPVQFGSVHDISIDETKIAYMSDGKIYVYNLSTKENKSYDAADSYITIGDLTFSPNGKLLVYAGVKGQTSPTSGVYLIDLDNNITTKKAERENVIFHIKRWTSNTTDGVEYYYFPYSN